MQKGVKVAASIASHEYDENFQEHSRRMATSTVPASEATRRAELQSLIVLGRKHIQQLRTFNSLHQAFGRISSAHEELTKAVSVRELELTSTVALLEAGKRLEANYDRALVANKSKAAQAVADKFPATW